MTPDLMTSDLRNFCHSDCLFSSVSSLSVSDFNDFCLFLSVCLPVLAVCIHLCQSAMHNLVRAIRSALGIINLFLDPECLPTFDLQLPSLTLSPSSPTKNWNKTENLWPTNIWKSFFSSRKGDHSWIVYKHQYIQFWKHGAQQIHSHKILRANSMCREHGP